MQPRTQMLVQLTRFDCVGDKYLPVRQMAKWSTETPHLTVKRGHMPLELGREWKGLLVSGTFFFTGRSMDVLWDGSQVWFNGHSAPAGAFYHRCPRSTCLCLHVVTCQMICYRTGQSSTLQSCKKNKLPRSFLPPFPAAELSRSQATCPPSSVPPSQVHPPPSASFPKLINPHHDQDGTSLVPFPVHELEGPYPATTSKVFL